MKAKKALGVLLAGLLAAGALAGCSSGTPPHSFFLTTCAARGPDQGRIRWGPAQ